MKISLTTITSDQYKSYYIKSYHGIENVGIHLLAAILRNEGHEVQVIDGMALSLSTQEVLNRLESFFPDVVGFSPTLFTMVETLELSAKLKRWKSPPLVILGGHHATLCAENIIRSEPDIDAIFFSEAEQSLVEMLNQLENRGSFDNIQGVVTRNLQKAQLAYPPHVADLKRLPNMARDALREMRNRHTLVSANIHASRGCLNDCSFCSTPLFYADPKNYRQRTPQSVVDEMESVCLRNDVHLFTFTDDNFLIGEKEVVRWAHQFGDELIKRKLPLAFSAMLRAEFFQPKYFDLLKKLKDAGLHQVLIGFESTARETLGKYQKQTNPKTYESVVRIVNELSLFLSPAFINLNPYLTQTDFSANITFLANIVNHPMLFHYISRLFIFPGSKIVSHLIEDNLLRGKEKNYKGEIPYGWIDPVIETLHKGFVGVANHPFEIDQALDETHHLLSYLQATGKISSQDHHSYFKRIKQLHKDIAAKHFAIMNECLEIALEMQSEKVSNLLEDYYRLDLSELGETVTRLREDFRLIADFKPMIDDKNSLSRFGSRQFPNCVQV